MKFHDPAREKIAGSPRRVGSEAALPRLSLYPMEDGSWTIDVFIWIDEERAARSYRAEVGDIGNLLTLWRECPEEVLESIFGWKRVKDWGI